MICQAETYYVRHDPIIHRLFRWGPQHHAPRQMELPVFLEQEWREEVSYRLDQLTTPTMDWMFCPQQYGMDGVAVYAAMYGMSYGTALSELVAGSPTLMEAIDEGDDDLAAGRFVSWDEVFGED